MGFAGSQFHCGPGYLQDPLTDFAMSVEDLQRTRGGNAIFGERTGLPYQVNGLADLKAVDVAVAFDGLSVIMLGYAEPGDGGGGRFIYDATSTAGDDGGTVIAPNGGGGRWIRTITSGLYSVLWFGAVNNAFVDSSAAVLSTIRAVETVTQGVVYFPTGNYRISRNQIATTGSNLYLQGSGSGAVFINVIGTTGDAITFTGGGRVGIRDLTIQQFDQTQTAGALVRFTGCQQIEGLNLNLLDGFGALRLDGCLDAFFLNVFGEAGVSWSGYKAGSYSLKMTALGIQPCSNVRFSNCTFRGNTSNFFLSTSMLIDSLDGAMFSTCGFGFCRIGISMVPATTSINLTGLQLVNFSIDTVTDYFAYFDTPGSYTGVFGGHKFVGGYCYNSTTNGILWNAANVGPGALTMADVSISTVARFGLWITRGRGLKFSGINFTDVCTGVGAFDCIQVLSAAAGTIYDLDFTDLSFQQYGAEVPAAVIELVPNGGIIDRITVIGINNKGATNAVVSQSGIGTNVLVLGVVSNQSWDVASAAAIYPALGHDVFAVTGTTGIGGIDARCAYKNRAVTLTFTTSVTVTSSAGFLLKGATNLAAIAGDSLTMATADGINWREIARTH